MAGGFSFFESLTTDKKFGIVFGAPLLLPLCAGGGFDAARLGTGVAVEELGFRLGSDGLWSVRRGCEVVGLNRGN